MTSLGPIRRAAKQLAQNTPVTGGLGVNLLLTDPDDFDLAVTQALEQFSVDRPYTRVIDHVVTTTSHRVVLRGTGALAELDGADAYSRRSHLLAVWYPWDASMPGLDPLDANAYRLVQDPEADVVLEFLAETLQVGQTLRLQFTRPHGLTEAPMTVPAPTVAPTVALAGSGSGNVSAGIHGYAVTLLTLHGETTPGPRAEISVSAPASDGKVSVVVGAVAIDGILAMRVYRTVANDAAGALKLVGEIASNGGTLTDNTADADLGDAAPSTNTAGGQNTIDDDESPLLVPLVASLILQMAANKAAQNTGNTHLPNDIVDRRTQSDVYAARARALRETYQILVGKAKDAVVGAHSAFGDLDTTFSDRRGFLWPRERHL